MGKRKRKVDAAEPQCDFQIKIMGNSDEVQDIVNDIQTSFNFDDFFNQPATSNSVEEVTFNLLNSTPPPLVAISDKNTEDNKPRKKLKMVDEQILPKRVVLVVPKNSPSRTSMPGTSSNQTPSDSVPNGDDSCQKIVTTPVSAANDSDKFKTPDKSSGINDTLIKITPKNTNNQEIKSPNRLARKKNLNSNLNGDVFKNSPKLPVDENKLVDINKLPKVEINFHEIAPSLNGNLKNSPKVKLQLRAADPNLLKSDEFKEKIRKFREKSNDSINESIHSLTDNTSVNISLIPRDSINNYLVKNKLTNDSLENDKNKSVDKTGGNLKIEKPPKKETAAVNSASASANVSKKNTTEVSENLVSTTTESTQLNNKINNKNCQCSQMNIMVDIVWGLLDKMKERSNEIDESKLNMDQLKGLKDHQDTDELLKRLRDKDQMITQLEEKNKELSEHLRREQLSSSKLRINLMSCQTELKKIKSIVKMKTDLINEVAESAVKVREYFGDEVIIGVISDTEDDTFSQT
ncbi:asparagine-rich protein-like [Microplitis mediator]|uniref:asparagine-rich protein-like n=1 Tax=Microplitis mediator TaxID=375433 RepID=UPI002553921C|nr:asparagine-rich protein-like [Microplitis mediator]